jgi:hypothetical protein
MKNLSEKVLLVNLSIGQWTGRAYDEEITMQVERDHSATNAGRYTKILIAEDALKEPQKAAGAARKFYYKETLPWTDNGDRILTATNYYRFMKEYQRLKAAFDKASEMFIKEYHTLKAEAKYRLQGMFKDDDYPDVLIVRAKFKMKIGVLPINNVEDFRLKVNAEEVRNLRSQIEQEITFRVNEANKSLWVRVKEGVGRVVEKLSQEDAVFRNSLIGNLEELIDLIPRLNFTDDEELEHIVEEIKPLIVDPDDLRDNPHLRNQKAEEAKAILDKVNDFLG